MTAPTYGGECDCVALYEELTNITSKKENIYLDFKARMNKLLKENPNTKNSNGERYKQDLLDPNYIKNEKDFAQGYYQLLQQYSVNLEGITSSEIYYKQLKKDCNCTQKAIAKLE